MLPLQNRSRLPLVTLNGVGLIYGSGATMLQAIDDISLDVWRGEVLMLTGPSGSGKTTLLQVIGLLLQPNTGTVVLEGRQLRSLSDRRLAEFRRKQYGFVFQGYNLFPTLTALENVMVALDLKGITGVAARAQSRTLLVRVGLDSKINNYPSMLSGGQRQRVAIARALAGNPSLLLADEPTAALDTEAGQSVMRLFRSLAVEDGHAVVVVTHDHRVLSQADRVMQMRDGRLECPEKDKGGEL